ncbi:MAG: biotin/lipoyl-binding protein [Bacteroidales bacterium]|nr:biotin/lipoyl-binding protein [Bacteroidales bacterium]
MKTYSFTLGGTHYDVTIEDITDGKASVSVNGTTYEVALDDIPVIPSAAPAPTAKPKESAAPKAAPAAGGPTTPVNSPLPGVIIEVSVKEGQAVKAGQKVAVLEAMKMENEITAPKDGTVTAIHVAKGDSVLEGALVVTIA